VSGTVTAIVTWERSQYKSNGPTLVGQAKTEPIAVSLSHL
jgi:hypothetical protein